MTLRAWQHKLVQDLTPRYDEGEAKSITRIVLEDAFHSRKRDLDTELEPAETTLANNILKRLVDGEPVQYVLGEADFFGLKFTVNPAVLIPRQETEDLVAWVVAWLKGSGEPAPTVLDIGLGTGCIGITIKHKLPGVQLFGMDASVEALEVAQSNADTLLPGKAVQFVDADALDEKTWPANWPLFDAIVSNPPYIPYNERHLMPEHVLEHEPHMALFVPKHDPLVFYKSIIQTAAKKLKHGGALFFECNEYNVEAVAMLFEPYEAWKDVELRNDLYGKTRFVYGWYLPKKA
ncbi:MAG: peptide chain release factor N(5)-glutamine methyltransferase [Saprospiraceae bacterium]|nr:peptide chain release factor N(5)-glutamine methyltransferase [Saprospiraceae bacterium]